LAAEHEVTPSWSDLLLEYSYGLRRLANIERAERMSNAAMNLLDTIIAGIAAVHDYQWVALESANGDVVDARSPRDVAAFLKSMQDLTQLLINLRDNMLHLQRELEGLKHDWGQDVQYMLSLVDADQATHPAPATNHLHTEYPGYRHCG
jgi:hypothetical protein